MNKILSTYFHLNAEKTTKKSIVDPDYRGTTSCLLDSNMNDDEIPNFSSEKEELKYWKDTAFELREKVDELEKELIEFQENSSQLEKELEKSLEHADRTNRDLKTKCNRLTLELDMCREKYEQQSRQSNKQISELQKEISEFVEKEEKLLKYIRDLEQKNDDLERAERVMLESAEDMEAKLNSAIERNALLENELDEKEMLKTMLQRLKDEQRDMQQDISRQRRQTLPDNNKVIERVRTPVDVNRLSLETQLPATTPMKIGSSVGQLSPSNRISAINLVGDLLRKVGSIESKLAASRISKDINDSPARESYKARNQRINRGTPSTFQNNIVKM